MTVIVGYRDLDGQVWIGADSLVTSERFRFLDPAEKAFRAGSWVIAQSGSITVLDMLQANVGIIAEFTKPQQIGDLIIEYAKALGLKPEQGDGELPDYMQRGILSKDNRLWEVSGCGQVSEIRAGFTAEGAGYPYAFGAWFALDMQQTGGEVVRICLEAACQFDASCGGPLTILKAVQ